MAPRKNRRRSHYCRVPRNRNRTQSTRRRKYRKASGFRPSCADVYDPDRRHPHVVYALVCTCDDHRSRPRAYIGYSGCGVERRLRQHQGILCGGAKKTRSCEWMLKNVIGPFPTRRWALQFEWSWTWRVPVRSAPSSVCSSSLRYRKRPRRLTFASQLNDALEVSLEWSRQQEGLNDFPIRVLPIYETCV